MKYKRDIKKISKEKNRVQRILEKLGTSPWETGTPFSVYSTEASDHIRKAIEHLHQAELELRKADW
jgi:hypothetical protein